MTLGSTPFFSSFIHVDGPPIVPTLTTSYAHGTSSTPMLYDTIGGMLQKSVERFPDKDAVVFVQDGVRKTFAQFQQEVSYNPTVKDLIIWNQPVKMEIIYTCSLK